VAVDLPTRGASRTADPQAREPARRPGPVPAAAAGATLSAVLVLSAVLGLVSVLVLALVAGGGAPAPAAPGLPDAGAVTGWGLPIAQLSARVAAVGTVGTVLFAAVLSPAPDGRLAAGARSAVRASSWWAVAWASTATVAALLTASTVLGVPLGRLSVSSVLGVLTELPSGRVASAVVVAALVLAVAARRCARRSSAAVLLSVAVLAVTLPALLTGHSAAAEHHVLAVSSLGVHVASASLWVGGLLALVLHGRGPAALASSAARFSTVALVCFLAAGSSGAVSAWVQLDSTRPVQVLLGSGYGALLLGKTTALVALGALGWWHRRVTLPQLRTGRPGAFRRFAVVEVVVMLATVALAVALSASPPPPAPAAAPAGPGVGAPSAAPGGTAAPGPAPDPAPEPAPAQDMAGHDHGTLSVGVLVDDERFHVPAGFTVGQTVTVYNQSTVEVTITAADGAFDVVVPGRTFATFTAPGPPGSYAFSSRHSRQFTDVLEVRAG
jgi:putative copper export protein